MSNNKYITSSSSGGIGFLGLLTIVLVIAKIAGYIELSWLWVFAPIWIPFAIGIVLVIVVVILSLAKD